jgi:hypothetical protein
MHVKKSAIGSVRISNSSAPYRWIKQIYSSFLPTRFGHTGNLAVQREIPEANATETKTAKIGARAPALHAAGVGTRRKFNLPLLFFTQSFSRHDRTFSVFFEFVSSFPKRHAKSR